MWLLLQSKHDDMQAARAAGVSFTAEEQAGFKAQFASTGTSRVMATAGSTAEILVEGVLTDTPDIYAMFFGGGNTTYPEIVAALAEADADPEIEEITMRFKSHGGGAQGMFDAIAAMQTTSKKITAIVHTAASAALGIASQADEIVAHNRASTVGSVGAVFDLYVDPNRVSVASTNAPHKRPDATKEEGKAVYRAEADAYHELFAEALASGRNTTVENVNAEYGRGAMLLADEALKRGMIDGIGKTALHSVKNTNSTATSGDQQEARAMDLNELKLKHPATFAAAVAAGTTEERERVSAHLIMGDASGDMATAKAAIEDGSQVTQLITAKYNAAAMKRDQIAARGADNVEDLGSDPVVTPDATAEAKEKADDSLVDAFAAACGVESDA